MNIYRLWSVLTGYWGLGAGARRTRQGGIIEEVSP